jgi:hypothetical protein
LTEPPSVQSLSAGPLLAKKEVRVAVLLCSLVLVNTAINALIIVVGSKGL